MKIVRFGPSGKMVCIGEDKNHSAWYVISDKVRNFIGKYKEGDDVSIRAEQSADGRTQHLVFITKAEAGAPSTGGEPQEPNIQTGEPMTSTSTYQKKSWTGKSSYTPKSTYGKSPEEQESIKRQAIGHMTSRTLIGLSAHLTPENLHEVMESIYNKYVELVG